MVTSSDLGVISGSQLQCFKECPFNKGYAIYGGHCIKLYMYFTSHANALGVCAADGAHLYHFKSLTKDRQPVIDLLYDNGIDHADVTLSFLWVGATDIVSEGSFVWSDGSPLPVGSDVWVSPLEPNDAGTGEDCARVILPEVKINDGPCSGGARFVCQIDF
ncbi:hypothetical protein BaRGS_00003033 [Batillaria attramentaria]|uniref:C-type lectin domain-containing protein n=1 Tax=Batillaria attramentaria TaxID=370345 RepID=A0ABD0M2C3_9CAEN